jgi:hypothetical protein
MHVDLKNWYLYIGFFINKIYLKGKLIFYLFIGFLDFFIN